MSFQDLGGNMENDLLYAKHDNKSGKFFYLGKLVGGDVVEGESKDVSDVNFLADFASARIGFGRYTTEYERQWQDNPGTPLPNADQLKAEGWKRCFQLWIYNSDLGVKLWERDSFMEWTGFLDVAKAWERDQANRNGKLPVINYEGSEKVTLKKGIFYKPVFKIVGWTDRPAEFIVPGFAQSDDVQDQDTGSKDEGSEEIPF